MSIPVYDPQDMKAIDRIAIEELGVSSVHLMERAARAVADAAAQAVRSHPGEIWLFCGTGNNGGDGIAAARFLREEGFSVRCVLLGEEASLSPDAAQMLIELRRQGGDVLPFSPDVSKRPGVVVDCLFGFSFHGTLRGEALAAAKWINASGAYVIACDLPSGVDPTTGRVEGEAVRADLTITMTGYKTGLLLDQGSEFAGKVQVADIGIPKEAKQFLPAAQVTSQEDAASCFPRRLRNTHKGDYGKVLLLCGSVGYTGAAALAARAALRAGSGLVFLGVPEPVYPILASKLDEAVVFPLPAKDGCLSEKAIPEIQRRLASMDACLIGPGLGSGPDVDEFVCAVLTSATCPVCLDADGINALSRHKDLMQSVSAPLVLTPHDGELARLCDLSCPGTRLEQSKAIAGSLHAVLLRKGFRTIITDGAACYVNPTGNPGMAVGGSGDVLSGIITSFLGRGISPLNAAASAAWLHGAAGDLAAKQRGEASMLPTDQLDALCEIIKELEGRSCGDGFAPY